MTAIYLHPTNAVARGMSLLAGLAAGAGAFLLLGPWVLALWLLPDLTLLAGMSREFAGNGRLAPRAVGAYNAVHAFTGPVLLVAAGALRSPVLLGLGLLWISHVAIDRASGYGLRDADGFQRV
jgi:hypothetical protein